MGKVVAVGMGRVVAVGTEVGRTAGTDVGEVASPAGITAASDVAVETGVASDVEAAPEQATAIMTIPGTASLPKIFRYLIQPLLPLPRWPTVDEGNCQSLMSQIPDGPNHHSVTTEGITLRAPMVQVTAESINYKTQGWSSSAIWRTRYEQNAGMAASPLVSRSCRRYGPSLSSKRGGLDAGIPRQSPAGR